MSEMAHVLKHIMLDENQVKWLKDMKKLTGSPEAFHVRAALDEYIKKHKPGRVASGASEPGRVGGV